MEAYLAPFLARFQLTLQYRAAALAGFVTQCWWGSIKVMIFAAFYGRDGTPAPLSLAQTASYIWLAQGLLALAPWSGDPEIAQAVRSSAVAYERVRPIDPYWYGYARAAAWLLARALPRAALMASFSGLLLPLFGLTRWSLQPPTSLLALASFMISLALGTLLSCALTMLMNAVVIAARDDRAVNALFTPLVILLSGNEIPLLLLPDWAQGFLFAQPLASVLDLPLRIYLGELRSLELGRALALQVFWIVTLIALGRRALQRAALRLEVQGG